MYVLPSPNGLMAKRSELGKKGEFSASFPTAMNERAGKLDNSQTTRERHGAKLTETIPLSLSLHVGWLVLKVG